MRLMVSPLQLFSGLPHYGKCAKQQNNRCGEPLVRKNCSQTAYQAKAVYRTVSITMPDRTVQPERKPAFARPSGTTTSATAPRGQAEYDTITITVRALHLCKCNRCKCSSSEPSRLRPNQFTKNNNIKLKKRKNQISFNIQCM